MSDVKQSEKDELLQSIDEVLNDKSFDIRYLLSLYFMMLLLLLVLFPKIYFQNNIYYESRKIARLQGEYNTLLEENKIIKMKVEKLKFKNQILDTIFEDY